MYVYGARSHAGAVVEVPEPILPIDEDAQLIQRTQGRVHYDLLRKERDLIESEIKRIQGREDHEVDVDWLKFTLEQVIVVWK